MCRDWNGRKTVAQFCFWSLLRKLRARIHGLYLVWSFAAKWQLLSPAKPSFFAEQKMRPNLLYFL
jgi:hypothetical protein